MSLRQQIDRLKGAKTGLESSIEGKGVTVPDEALIDTYSVYVDAIQQGGGGESYDFTEIGYSQAVSDGINNDTKNEIVDGIAYAKQIADTWNPNTTDARNYFGYDERLVYLPNINTAKVNSLCDSSSNGMFQYATKLQYIDNLSFPNIINKSVSTLFTNCVSLKKINSLSFGGVTTTANMFNNCCNLKEAPLFNTTNCTRMDYMFANCNSLESIPSYDMGNVTQANNMFDGCRSLENVPPLNTVKCTRMDYMFRNCKKLKTVPSLDFSATANISYMFRGCDSLEEVGDMRFNIQSGSNASYFLSDCPSLKRVGSLDFNYVQNISYLFNGSINLESIGLIKAPLLNASIGSFFTSANNLTEFEGIENLKMNWNDSSGLAKCPNLTHQSLINILNNLYDFTGNGVTPSSSQGKLKLGINYNKLSAEDLAIGTNKGWQITA